MCGIVCSFLPVENQFILRTKVLEMARRIRHRGPDSSGIYGSYKAHLAHERLAISDFETGSQPLYNADQSVVLVVNGEIYNHEQLRGEIGVYPYQSQSDSEVLMALYLKYGIDFLDKLNGMYAFAIYDTRNDSFFIARDHLGIIPLYHGYDSKGQYFIASELKSLEGFCDTIAQFPPGHYLYSREGMTPIPYYKREWEDFDAVAANISTDTNLLRQSLENSVRRQMALEVPFAVLLSGGLDSSIIASIAKQEINEQNRLMNQQIPLHSFAIGLQGAPDLLAARKVADYLGTTHHEVQFTLEEGIDALRDVIYSLETYDVTTVRASTPMYLLARVMKSMGIKAVLSGEGSDELFGGYLYFHKAPSARAFHEETVRKLKKLYLYDCLRANKSLSAWGIEGRVPFLDIDFVDTAMRINPSLKLIDKSHMEKWILRKAFENCLPDEILWRQKEQFSDGVGYSWISTLKQYAEQEVNDGRFQTAASRFPVNTPLNKEEYFYRTIFEELFPSAAAAATVPSVKSVACSTPEALAWDSAFQTMNDPSGRSVLQVHNEAFK
ncbi:asparagine synthase B [Pedobacter gandavensis]|uniref:asparagine synthase B n=1 Tax=Pedobacter gandavensis TaxID=2679963 RepID=UPI002931C564|nr:asparagine synthase B [Pedobacter gandavensis]